MAFSNIDILLNFHTSAHGACECCGKKIVWGNRDKGEKGAWHAHHIVPKSVRVDDSINNMAMLCINNPENCHLNKGHGGNYKKAQPKKDWVCK